MTSSPAAAVPTGRSAPLKRKIAAILAADVAGYSRLVAEDEERTLHELGAARAVFDALVERGGGRIFNTAGDSVMCEFDSAVEAVRVAVDIQDALAARQVGTDPARRLEFRMGLTIGDVVERDGDLLGEGVNIAARLEAMAPPGGICVSRSVHEAVANKLAVGFTELGARQAKNIPQPIHAYLIARPIRVPGGGDPLVARQLSVPVGSPRGRRRGGYVGAAAAAILLAAGLLAGPPVYHAVRPHLAGSGGAGPAPQVATAPPAPSESPPANEDRTVRTGQAASPAAARPPKAPAAERPARPAPREAQARPEAARAEPAKSEPGKPEPAKSEPAKPEAGRAARALPADPAAAFAALAAEGVLPDARTLPELYHNARILEAKGDRPAALAAYAAAAALPGDYVDLHLRHASLLRAARGPAAPRQAYAALARSNPSRAVTLVGALSAEGEERAARLEAAAAAEPGPGAADFLLAESRLDRRAGGPTLTERRLAFDALERFLEASGAGELAGRFVDRSVLDGWLDGARRRRGEIEAAFAASPTRPAASFARTAQGWLARFTLPEPATAVAVRIGERGEPQQLGRNPDGRGGKTLSQPEIELPRSSPRTVLYVTYRDRADLEAGPFPLTFDPAAAEAEGGRAALERFPESWVAFRPDIPDLLSYAGLVSNRCAISRARIGFGGEPPRDPLPIPPCDPTGPATMPSGAALLTLPDGTETVQIQLTYADGSESQVRSFHRP